MRPTLTKGQFLGTKSGRVITCMFNPSTLTWSTGFTHGEHTVPLRSHPIYGGGAGKGKSLTIDLHLDADRGRSRPKFPLDLITGIPPTGAADRDIMPEVNELESMALPYDVAQDGAYGVPESFLFTFGTIFRGEVLVEDVDVNVSDMFPDLRALRADVRLTLQVVAHYNQTTWRFLSARGSDIKAPPPIDPWEGIE